MMTNMALWAFFTVYFLTSKIYHRKLHPKIFQFSYKVILKYRIWPKKIMYLELLFGYELIQTENTVWMGEKWKTFLVPLQSPRTDMRYFL